MMADKNSQTAGAPQPHPSLKALDQFIGTWSISGRTLGSQSDNIKGKTTFRKLPGGFFVEQHIKMDFDGYDIDALELIGYSQATKRLDSLVYTSLSDPLPYSWKVDGDDVYITMPIAKFKGKFENGGKSYQGSWRPDPGKEGPGNVAYDITGHRIN